MKERKLNIKYKRLILVVSIFIIIYLLLFPSYFVMKPGETKLVDSFIEQGGQNQAEASLDSSLYYTTVLLQDAKWIDIVSSLFNRDVTFLMKKDVLQGRSQEAYKATAQLAMYNAFNDALQASYTFLDIAYEEEEHSGRTIIQSTEDQFNIYFNENQVGGGSAGLVLALAIIERLQPDILNVKYNIAATGILDRNGKVEPVGGIEQKVVSVTQNQIDYFIVPQVQFEQAQKKAESINSAVTIIGVSTLKEAIVAINSLAQ